MRNTLSECMHNYDLSTVLCPGVAGVLALQSRYVFESVSEGRIITNLGSRANLLASEGVGLVTGKGGAQFVELDGRMQTVVLDTQSGANGVLSNPGDCHMGFTLTFTAKVQTLCENMYILTSGGDLEQYSGVAVYYHRGWTYVTVSTAEHRWAVQMEEPELEKYTDYEISWGQDLGLQVSVGEKTVSNRMYSLRKTLATKTTSLYIGGPVPDTQGCYARLLFGALQVFTAPKSVLQITGVITGKRSINSYFHNNNTNRKLKLLLLLIYFNVGFTEVVPTEN